MGVLKRPKSCIVFDTNVKAILEFINKSKNRYDVYADSKGPSYVIKIEALRKSYVEFVRRGGHIQVYH